MIQKKGGKYWPAKFANFGYFRATTFDLKVVKTSAPIMQVYVKLANFLVLA